MLIAIDENDPRPIYAQIVAGVKEQIHAGVMRPGDELPSVRELAEMLSINLHTAHRAYQQLREQGVIILRLGQRARVASPRRQPLNRAAAEAKLVGSLRELITEAFHLGISEEDFRALMEAAFPGKKGTRL